MKASQGFPAGKLKHVLVPVLFFKDVLPLINNLYELKVTLHVMYIISAKEGNIRYLRESELADDEVLLQGLSKDIQPARGKLTEALSMACERGTLLRAKSDSSTEPIYFLNTARSRALVQAMTEGKWTPGDDDSFLEQAIMDRPNIFQIYEENIGPLTPLIADSLREAEVEFSEAWIRDAVRIAVANNVRKWRYVDAILRSWKEEGRHAKDQTGSRQDRRKYLEGEFADFIEH